MIDLAWLVLLLPLLSAVVITLFTQGDPKLSAQLSIGAVEYIKESVTIRVH